MYPALAVAEAINQHDPEIKQYYVGSVNGFERPLVEQAVAQDSVSFAAYDEIYAGPLHGVGVLTVLRSVVLNATGVFQSLRLMIRYRPGAIFLTGGWVSLPVAVGGWLLRVPILIFLPDIEPGLAIKTLRRLAKKVATSLPESAQYFPDGQTVVTGYPVRAEVAQATRDAAIEYFGLDATRKTLLVFGGSRGAQSINTAVIEILPRLLSDGVQVIHITGKLDWERVRESTQNLPDASHYHPVEYLHDEMGLALAAADLVLSRSGAGVLGEFPLFGVPSILVPYPYAWRYQKVNADYLADRGAAITMPDEQMATDLYPTIHKLFTNAEQLVTMRGNVEKLAQPDSAGRVATELIKLAGEHEP